ncbi:hypothetical protein PCANC_19189 [Puccinia coronata f. sp. avenae]|uniref:Uncharacterized protein n=1 Tax=Puccinia coronata f. sp. avenae TaxID=200324 RepID=A0A2N5RX26_9BASI|nr:hypothetical protein PCASD_24099 [Puccinia coronata f. sp. avenae]PLW25754.1 hypothetical protein PCASD_17921 [Puccinia coronata f. sp. avenae]PLW31449.1 hypothetical protein PCANC_17555 [Puccinia coronata f. sp. avenae]PLW31935.1 hypothetical protein PCANC_19189 [Puccinia coronata f. sp. avenae]
MTIHYACPHLSTCCNVKYIKKHCDDHSRLSIDRITKHTLNKRIHSNCQPSCPAFNLTSRTINRFEFQKINTPTSGDHDLNTRGFKDPSPAVGTQNAVLMIKDTNVCSGYGIQLVLKHQKSFV